MERRAPLSLSAVYQITWVAQWQLQGLFPENATMHVHKKLLIISGALESLDSQGSQGKIPWKQKQTHLHTYSHSMQYTRWSPSAEEASSWSFLLSHIYPFCCFIFSTCLFIMALLGLCCCMGFSLVVVSRGYFVSGCGLLTAVASLVAEHKLWSTQASVVAVPGL